MLEKTKDKKEKTFKEEFVKHNWIFTLIALVIIQIPILNVILFILVTEILRKSNIYSDVNFIKFWIYNNHKKK